MIVECAGCGKEFKAERRSRKYHSDACRKAASRKKADAHEASTSAELPGPTITQATYDSLVECKRETTPLGRVALSLALRLDKGVDSGSAMAALAKELRAALQAATVNAAKKSDPIDELEKQRQKRRSRGA